MQTPDSTASLLTPIGYVRSSCGYCGKTESFSYYASTKALTHDFYQLLIDRGWRRSGSVLYKPDLKASCCQQYTIRLDSDKFHASKDQRQCINRFNKHILGDSYIKEAAKLYPLSREQAKRRDTEFDLPARVHESEKAFLKTPPEPSHEFTVTLEPDEFTEEKYDLFAQYQRKVHHEPESKISKRGFSNFLCNSPLLRSEVNGHRLGSYHQCYRIGGELVAIGVLDILPHCVSGVYFIYHDDVHKHSFGKLGALREIALAKEEGYRYWYAGFYIHSCPKMQYKGDFHPQSMLDPESYSWDPLDKEMKRKLEEHKYVSISGERLREASGLPPSVKSEDVIPNDAIMEIDEVKDKDLDVDIDEDIEEDEDEDEDEDGDKSVKDPTIPLFERSIPGVLTRDQLVTEIDLDQIKLQLFGNPAVTSDLVAWEESDMDNNRSIKGIIAELVAAVGPQIAEEMTVAFY